MSGQPSRAVSYPEDLQEAVEEGLRAFFPQAGSFPDALRDAMAHTVFAGGKRFRPVLHLAVGRAAGADPSTLLPTACAIEFVHSYSLIHDDLPAIDNDDMRRGKPTCHRVFGEAMAILAGDALFSEAFHLIAHRQAGAPERVLRALQGLAEATGVRGMVGGQVLDIQMTGEIAEVEQLQAMHLNKTARLIAFSAGSGAVLAGCSDEAVGAIEGFGRHVGLAFQIVDDLLDVVGKSEVLGKTAGSDARKEKFTYASLLGVAAAQKAASDEIRAAKQQLRRAEISTGTLEQLADFVLYRPR